jgi:hypothetical protein
MAVCQVLRVPVPTIPDSYFVTMHQIGFSDGGALFTYGAGPCINIVVYDREKHSGCMAHVHNRSTKTEENFENVEQTIDQMLKKIKSSGNTEVYLFAGGEFNSNLPNGTTLLQYLRTHLLNPVIYPGELIDHRGIGGALLYIPATAQIYVLGRSDVHKCQEKMLTIDSKQPDVLLFNNNDWGLESIKYVH